MGVDVGVDVDVGEWVSGCGCGCGCGWVCMWMWFCYVQTTRLKEPISIALSECISLSPMKVRA